MMNQTQASLTPAISERKATETTAVCTLVITYLGLFTLYSWYQQFRLPFIDTESLKFYWEMIKYNPFSDVGMTYAKLFFNAISGLYIMQWGLFITIPFLSTLSFFIARSKLKKLPMHEAAEGGKLSILGRTLSLFIEGKAQFFMLFCVGYSFFATSAFANYVIDFFMQRARFNLFDIFLAFMSFVLVWLFIRPFMAFYVISISKKG